MIRIRRTKARDMAEMSSLLNAIIRAGGTTALTREVPPETLHAWFLSAPGRSAWHVAEEIDGGVLGFQYVQPHEKLPQDACNIATFVRIGHAGGGIGTRLFQATREAAKALGYRWINATIRADNTAGLAYYAARGFNDHPHHESARLADGTVVDRIAKRFDL